MDLLFQWSFKISLLYKIASLRHVPRSYFLNLLMRNKPLRSQYSPPLVFQTFTLVIIPTVVFIYIQMIEKMVKCSKTALSNSSPSINIEAGSSSERIFAPCHVCVCKLDISTCFPYGCHSNCLLLLLGIFISC